jgi:hypothetical protein
MRSLVLSASGCLHVIGTVSVILFIEVRLVRLRHKAARCHDTGWSLLDTPIGYFDFEIKMFHLVK